MTFIAFTSIALITFHLLMGKSHLQKLAYAPQRAAAVFSGSSV
jgi:hypothetical protein